MDSGAGQEFADHTLQPPQPMQEPRELPGLLTAGLPALPQALQGPPASMEEQERSVLVRR